MPSISVQPALGTVPAALAALILPTGAAAPLHVLAGATGAALAPMTDASAQAFAAAVTALSAVLLPRAGVSPQAGPFIFGFPA